MSARRFARMIESKVEDTYRGDPQTAEDLTADVFLKMVEAIPGYRIEATDRLIFEDNLVSGAHLLAIGNDITTFWSNYCRHIRGFRSEKRYAGRYDSVFILRRTDRLADNARPGYGSGDGDDRRGSTGSDN